MIIDRVLLLAFGSLSAALAVWAVEGGSALVVLPLALYAASPWWFISMKQSLTAGRMGAGLLLVFVAIAGLVHYSIATSDSSTEVLGIVFLPIYQWFAIVVALLLRARVAPSDG
jgi:hypothetical protein